MGAAAGGESEAICGRKDAEGGMGGGDKMNETLRGPAAHSRGRDAGFIDVQSGGRGARVHRQPFYKNSYCT